MAGFPDKPLAMPIKASPYREGQGVWEDGVRCLEQVDLELRLWVSYKTCGVSDDKRRRRVTANAKQMASGDSLIARTYLAIAVLSRPGPMMLITRVTL
jgi:hypothetical protein